MASIYYDWTNRTYAETGGGTQLTLDKPSSTTEGCLLVAVFCGQTMLGSFGAPDGWTQGPAYSPSGSHPSVHAFYRIAGSSEPSTYTFSWEYTKDAAGEIFTVENYDATTPMYLNAGGSGAVSGTRHWTERLNTGKRRCLVYLVEGENNKGGTTVMATGWPNAGIVYQEDIGSGGGVGHWARTVIGNTIDDAGSTFFHDAALGAYDSVKSNYYYTNMVILIQEADLAGTPPTGTVEPDGIETSQGTTTGGNHTVTLPSGSTGDLLVVGIRVGTSTASATLALSSGYTEVGDIRGQAVYYKTAGASEPNPTFTFSLGSGYEWVAVAFRFPAGTTVADADSADGYVMPTSSPGSGDYTFLYLGGGTWASYSKPYSDYPDNYGLGRCMNQAPRYGERDDHGLVWRWPSSGSDVVSLAWGYRRLNASSYQPPIRFYVQGSFEVYGVMAVLALEAETGPTVVLGTAALSATGTLSGTAAAMTTTGIASLSATGTTQGSALAVTTGAASLSAAGTLQASGVPFKLGAADLTTTGTLQGAGVVVVVGQAALTATGTLQATGLPLVIGATSLSAVGTVEAAGLSIVPGAAALSAAGDLTATGLAVTTGACALTAAGTVEATATVLTIVLGEAALTATGTVEGTGLVTVSAAAALTATADLDSTTLVTTTGACSLSATGGLEGSALNLAIGAASLTATGTVTADATVFPPFVPGEADLDAVGTVEATGTVVVLGTAALDAAGEVIGTGLRIAEGTAALASPGNLAATGLVVEVAAATLTATGTIQATGTVFAVITGAANLSSAATVEGTALAVVPGETALTATASLEAAALSLVVSASSLSATGTLSGTPLLLAINGAALSSTATAAAAALIWVVAAAGLSSTGTVQATATVYEVEEYEFPCLVSSDDATAEAGDLVLTATEIGVWA